MFRIKLASIYLLQIIIIEPYYEFYEIFALLSGAKCKFLSLKPKLTDPSAKYISSSDWVLSDDELEGAFNSKTKLIVINNPNNPLGKVYTREELEKIADLCIKHNVICLSDEVYEHITYDREHIRMGINSLTLIFIVR